MEFSFKQFAVRQDKCAMKVGTDGVLLGAWTSLEHRPQTVLDIGAGTGLISLQLGQRSDAEQLDAVEIDADAYEQCVENFENAPWNDRLFCFHASLAEFVHEMQGETYDLIVSNPPYFAEPKNVGERDASRVQARSHRSLPFEELVASAASLLSDVGELAVIIPFSETENFVALAEKYGCYPKRITHVRGTPTAPLKRSLLQFSFRQSGPVTNELVIETARHQYTEAYKVLVQDFYINM